MTEMGQVEEGLGLGLALGSLDNLVHRHLQDLKVCGDGKLYSGHLDSEEEFTLFVDDLKALGFSFSTENSKIYKHSRILFSSSMRNSEFKIPYFGSPFQIIKSSYLLCSQGGNYRPQLLSPLQQGQTPSKKRRFSLQPTKKIGCKALMTVKCIRIFSDDCYKAKSSTYKDGSYENRLIMSKLNKDLQKSCPPTGTIRFMIVMSTADEHNHTVVSTNLNQILHPRLREEIHKCATSCNICTVKAMKKHLVEFVRCMFEGEDRPQPDSLNRCYYPTDTSLRFHMRQAGFTIARSKRQIKNVDSCIIESNIDGLFDIDVGPHEQDADINLQIQPTVKTTTTCFKREKTALEKCIILQRVDTTKQNMDEDVGLNQEYSNVLLQMQPTVLLWENTDENTAPENCVLIQRATDSEDESSSENVEDDVVEFYSEEQGVSIIEADELLEEASSLNNVTNLKTLADETREDLKTMVRYTYMLQTPESILEMSQLTRQLKEKMISSVLMTNDSLLDPTDLNIPLQTNKQNLVESIKKKYLNLPKHSKPRNNGKYVDQHGFVKCKFV